MCHHLWILHRRQAGRGGGGGWAAAVVLRALFFFPWLVLMEECRGCVSETAFWLAGVPLGCGSLLPLLAFKNRLVGRAGVWQLMRRDWLQRMSEDTHSTPWHFSKVTAVTGALRAAATVSRSSLQNAGEWAPRVPFSHAPDPECQCLLCRSDAGHRAQSHVLGALVETHFIVNRTASSTVWAWPW